LKDAPQQHAGSGLVKAWRKEIFDFLTILEGDKITMRIQHNITALNAYRNYNNNVSKVGKNLEKLSSGYRINRAGDDAAGLAVSQKMRLQIAGLEQAQKNAKSGISMVQTAEGALTEVHDMLERMYTLAEQSANGTFDGETDRAQLQKELESLQNEITRIGKTANFNGIGIFQQYESSAAAGADTYYEATGTVNGAAVAATEVPAANAAPAAKAKYVFDFTGKTALQNGEAVTVAGVTINAKSTGGGAGAGDINVSNDDDLSKQLTSLATLLGNDAGLKDKYTVSKVGDTIVLEAKTEGADADAATTGDDAIWNSNNVTLDATKSVTGADATNATPKHNSYDLQNMQDGESITVNGKTFTKAAADDADKGEFKDFAGLKAAAAKANIEVGGTEAAATFKAKPADDDGEKKASDIWFAIGAEPTASNKLTLGAMNLALDNIGVTPNTEAAAAAGEVTSIVAPITGNISGINIADQQSAWDALSAIKNATNAVSDMRGSLGAVQNRLDHTINNLSVMQENMTDAESVIRDTDIAEEMMAYTKNNILVQSAQAMLAQANQLPQGVLQLLG